MAGGSRDLLECDVMEVGGVRVTTPARTAVDLACKLSARDGLAALDAFMREFGITRRDLRRLLVRYFRRRGVRQARPLVAMADARSESSGESWTRYEILTHGLPAPEPQHWIEIDGVPTFRLDLAYARHRIAVEYDGQEFHSRDADRQHDSRRRNEFSLEMRGKGMGLLESAIEGAKLRFRPVMMTSFAFILGLVPLITATGPGSASRIAVGTPVFWGMLASAILGIMLIPMLYVTFQYLREKAGWKPAHATETREATPPRPVGQPAE